ncbi:hypothetical protein ACF0H5_023851 [Mactra antiquata]
MGKSYVPSERRSNRRNKARRATQFKKGHTGFNKKCLPENTVENSTCQNNNSCENLPDNTVDSSTIERRLDTNQAADVVHISGNVDTTVPYRLRSHSANSSDNEHDKHIDGNIIVSVIKLENLLQIVHPCQSSAFKITIKRSQGLNVTVAGKCDECKMVVPEFGLSEMVSQ